MNTVSKNRNTAIGVTMAAMLGAGAISAPAAAAAPATGSDEPVPPSASTTADISGDGGPELVTVRAGGDDTSGEHVVSARFADHSYVESAYPADSTARYAIEPRPADLNRDGKAEIVTATESGANTITFTAFTYVPEQGFVQLTGTDGTPFTFHDGGGATMRVSYGCHGPGADDSTFRVVQAERGDDGTYDASAPRTPSTAPRSSTPDRKRSTGSTRTHPACRRPALLRPGLIRLHG
ncbi:hypothetical protein [Saccharomonospora sp. CUA-673]|uniref:hypothetical protein n=1 Tax=Saccharomonospora sp. CUA-673 TaxID=1904969 RepID=UPI001115070A|nr:hypothetical protein [Saccharomonospora sp. CUA-673]